MRRNRLRTECVDCETTVLRRYEFAHRAQLSTREYQAEDSFQSSGRSATATTVVLIPDT